MLAPTIMVSTANSSSYRKEFELLISCSGLMLAPTIMVSTANSSS
jgi:hypothetical protein